VRFGCKLVRLKAQRPTGWRVVYECGSGPDGAPPRGAEQQSYHAGGGGGGPLSGQASLVAGAGASVASSGVGGPVGAGGGSFTTAGGNNPNNPISFSQGFGGGGAIPPPTSPLAAAASAAGAAAAAPSSLWRVDADYVVIATGIYALPQAPQYRDAARFQGLVMHAKDFRDTSAVRGRHVLVIGAGKSALDVGGEVAASRSAASITWLMRQSHWPVPRTLRLLPPLGLPLPAPDLFFSRAAPALLLPPYYTAGPLRRLAAAAASPLQRLAWWAVERAIVRQFDLRGPLLPKVPLREDLFFGGQILDATWTRLVQYGAQGGGGRSSLNDGAESVSTGGGGGTGGASGGGGGAGVTGRGFGFGLGGGGRGSGGALSSRLGGGPGSGGRRSRGSRGSGGAAGPASGGYRSGPDPFERTGSGSGSDLPAAGGGADLSPLPDGAAAVAPSPSHSHPLPTVAEAEAEHHHQRQHHHDQGLIVLPAAPDDPAAAPPAATFASPFSAAAATAGNGSPPPTARAHSTSRLASAVLLPPTASSYPPAADACAAPTNTAGSSDPLSPLSGGARPQCCHVRPLLGEVARFLPRGVVLRSGEEVYCDAVLYCTGYQKTYDYLDGGLKSRLGLQKDGLWLYRQVLAPLVPGLAFIGAEASTFNNVLTSGLQAEWLARLLSGRLDGRRVPKGVEGMMADVRRQQAWRRRVMPVQHARGSCVQMYAKCYHEQLLRDMGLKGPVRKKKGEGAEDARRARAAASGSHPPSSYTPPALTCLRPLTAEDYAHAFAPPDFRHGRSSYDDDDSSEEEEGDMEQQRGQQQRVAAAAAAAAAADAAAALPPDHPRSAVRAAEAAAAAAAARWRPPPAHLILQPPGSFTVRERVAAQERDALVAALVGAPPPSGREWTVAAPADAADLAGGGGGVGGMGGNAGLLFGGQANGAGLPSSASLKPPVGLSGGSFVSGSGGAPFAFLSQVQQQQQQQQWAGVPYSGSSGPSAGGGGGAWRQASVASGPQQAPQTPPTHQSSLPSSGLPSSGALPAAPGGSPRAAGGPSPPPPPYVLGNGGGGGSGSDVPGSSGAGAGAGNGPPRAAAAAPADPRVASAIASLRAWQAASPAAAAADRLVASRRAETG
jgi:hypothetical protein